MTCDDVRELLLEADPEDLLETGTSPLSGHLRECAACRAIGLRLHAGLTDLRAGYAALQPSAPAGAMVRELITADVVPLDARRRTIRRIWGTVGVGLAAGIALTVMTFPRPATPVQPVATAPAETDSMPSLDVEVPPGRNALVMTTSNPKISVVWLY